jgi:hypothetical protein
MQPSIPQSPPSSGVLNEQRVFQRIDVIRQRVAINIHATGESQIL